MVIEILRVHEDYVTTTTLTLMLLNGLLLRVAPSFSKPLEETSKELSVFLKWFYMSEEEKGTSVYRSSSLKSI